MSEITSDQLNQLSDEELKQQAVRMRAAGLPLTAQPPTVRPVAAVAQPPAQGSVDDLESRAARPLPPSVAKAAAHRGVMPNNSAAVNELNRDTVQAGGQAPPPTPVMSPEDRRVQSAQDRVDDIQNSKAGIARLIPITEGEGFGHRLLRGVEHVGRGIATGIETAANIAAPGIMLNIPGTQFNRAVRLQGAQSQLGEEEKNREMASKSEQEQATAKQKGDLSAIQIAAREKGFDIQQDPLTGKYSAVPLPASQLAPQQQATLAATNSPKVEFKQNDQTGEVIQLTTDHEGKTKSDVVAHVDPKIQTDVIQRKMPDGTQHNILVDKIKGTDIRDLGPTAKGGGAEGKVYDNYSKQIDKVSAPMDTMAGRADRLLTNLNMKTKQADSFIAPEILTIVAGGAGSGLRMTEAEIARVIGGRSVWDGLKAQMNQVVQDGGTFDDNQRAQLTQVAQYIQTKSAAQNFIVNQARQHMLDAQDDDKQVRGIYSHMQQTLSSLEQHGITPRGQQLRPGDFVWTNNKLYEVEIEHGKPMGVPVDVK